VVLAAHGGKSEKSKFHEISRNRDFPVFILGVFFGVFLGFGGYNFQFLDFWGGDNRKIWWFNSTVIWNLGGQPQFLVTSRRFLVDNGKS